MNIFQAVIRPFQTQTSVSASTNQQSAEAVDREEDGFLMVAETESERTTVYASSYSGDSPPDYNHAQTRSRHNPLPTYMGYMQNNAPQNQESQLNYSTLPLTCHSEISGVDFAVSPHLRMVLDIHQSARQASSSIHNEGIQASRFSYDFSLEEKVLCDAQHMEMR